MSGSGWMKKKSGEMKDVSQRGRSTVGEKSKEGNEGERKGVCREVWNQGLKDI